MNRMPVLRCAAKTVLNTESDQFQEKLPSERLVFNLGDAWVFSCSFCYVGTIQRYLAPPLIKTRNEENGTSLQFRNVVIRRGNALKLVRDQFLKKDGIRRFPDPADRRVVYSSSLVDVAANKGPAASDYPDNDRPHHSKIAIPQGP